jgi:hypothetical protein
MPLQTAKLQKDRVLQIHKAEDLMQDVRNVTLVVESWFQVTTNMSSEWL